MEEKKKLIKQSKIMIAMALVIVLALAGTYAWMMITRTSTVVNKITAGTLDLILDESSSDGIHLEKQVPMSFQQGLTTTPYTFKIVNNGDTAANYTISLEDFYEGVTIPEEGKFEDSKIRYILLKDDETPVGSNSKLLSAGRELTTGTIEGSTEVSFTLYMWIDSRAGIEVNGQIFSGRLNITAEQAKPKYTVSGTLTDGEEQIVANATLLGFTQSGSQVVATTDTEGKFSMDNLPAGENKIYYVPTGLDISDKTKAEVDNMTGIASITINAPTSTQRAVMTNNYVIKDVITKKISSTSTNKSNKNILAAYTYVKPTNIIKSGDTVTSYDGCITGEESQCVETTCYENKTEGSCPAGTIIKYKVNDSEEKYFHVLHDDGDKLTLQQRENTIANTAWYSSGIATNQGPITVLPVLENATSGWTNVNDLSYTLGTDTLYQNSATGCVYPESGNALTCSYNTYTLGKRTAKARMIIGQETAVLGCKFGTHQSCPNWMNNYLYNSTSYGGTLNNNTDANGNNIYGYWTMSDLYSSFGVWYVNYSGRVHSSSANTSTYYGARAVVEINK